MLAPTSFGRNEQESRKKELNSDRLLTVLRFGDCLRQKPRERIEPPLAASAKPEIALAAREARLIPKSQTRDLLPLVAGWPPPLDSGRCRYEGSERRKNATSISWSAES